jgi:hypothetical protein
LFIKTKWITITQLNKKTNVMRWCDIRCTAWSDMIQNTSKICTKWYVIQYDMWYNMIRDTIWYMIQYDMWYNMIHDTIWYMIQYEVMWHNSKIKHHLLPHVHVIQLTRIDLHLKGVMSEISGVNLNKRVCMLKLKASSFVSML